MGFTDIQYSEDLLWRKSGASARVRPPELLLFPSLFSSLLPGHFPSVIALFRVLGRRFVLAPVTAREVCRSWCRFGLLWSSRRDDVQWSWPWSCGLAAAFLWLWRAASVCGTGNPFGVVGVRLLYAGAKVSSGSGFASEAYPVVYGRFKLSLVLRLTFQDLLLVIGLIPSTRYDIGFSLEGCSLVVNCFITVDTGDYFSSHCHRSSVLEGGKRHPDFRLRWGGVPLVLSSHPSADDVSLDSSLVVLLG
ncbi:hypothetical protein N665_0211s0046 [Sinapis alba]|nr:hypothetical protein N665_0211s0046 [Sinapis alba]